MRLPLLATAMVALAAPAAAATLVCQPQQFCNSQGCGDHSFPLQIQDFDGSSPIATIDAHSYRVRKGSIAPPRLLFTGRFNGLPVEIEVDSESGALAWKHGEELLVIGTCRPA